MTREGYVQFRVAGKVITLSEEEIDRITEFCREHDPKLPADPYPQQVIRSLYKVARQLAAPPVAAPPVAETAEPSVEPGSGQAIGPAQIITEGPPAAVGRLDPDNAESGDTAAAEARQDQRLDLIRAQIELEKQKANTFYWNARSKGRAATRETTLVSQQPSAGFYCRLHRTEHSNGPCPEIMQMSKETGLPLSNAQFGYVVP